MGKFGGMTNVVISAQQFDLKRRDRRGPVINRFGKDQAGQVIALAKNTHVQRSAERIPDSGKLQWRSADNTVGHNQIATIKWDATGTRCAF